MKTFRNKSRQMLQMKRYETISKISKEISWNAIAKYIEKIFISSKKKGRNQQTAAL